MTNLDHEAEPIDRAAARTAGYGDEDIPMRPRRSGYTDDIYGAIAYGKACGRWVAYRSLVSPGGKSLA